MGAAILSKFMDMMGIGGSDDDVYDDGYVRLLLLHVQRCVLHLPRRQQRILVGVHFDYQ